MVLTSFVDDTAGVVCDRGLTLRDLIGVLNEFFARLGMFPFTVRLEWFVIFLVPVVLFF